MTWSQNGGGGGKDLKWNGPLSRPYVASQDSLALTFLIRSWSNNWQQFYWHGFLLLFFLFSNIPTLTVFFEVILSRFILVARVTLLKTSEPL